MIKKFTLHFWLSKISKFKLAFLEKHYLLTISCVDLHVVQMYMHPYSCVIKKQSANAEQIFIACTVSYYVMQMQA